MRALTAVSAWSWIWAVVLGSAAVLAILIGGIRWPVDWWYEPPEPESTERALKQWALWLGSTSALIAAATAFVTPVRTSMRRASDRRALEDVRRAAKLDVVARSMLGVLIERLDGDDVQLWKNATVALRVVDRRPRNARLTTVAEAKNHSRTPSGLSWVRGKGACGTAWLEQKTIHLNMRDAGYLAAAADETIWNTYEDRQDLTFVEVKRLVDQPYGAVAAIPLVSEGEVVGVASLDIPDGYFAALVDAETTRQLEVVVASGREELAEIWAAYEY